LLEKSQRMSELRLPAEKKFADELAALAKADQGPKPPQWRLSPRAVETYIMGAPKPVGGVAITPKYIGDRSLVQVAIATLASDRALMLAGEPGTAKSWLSEHLSAAICGTSLLTVQGTAGTSEDHLKYGWNYALLIAEGPSERALVPSPILRAMRDGAIARVEEITRTSPVVQDALISILSETANTRDRGVNEMSAALKRRFNFVTVPVVDDLEQEIAIVKQREAQLRTDYQVGTPPPDELTKLLVTVFQELRNGASKDGKTKVRTPSGVLSTAEAISVLFNSGILAQSFGSGAVGGSELARALVGALAKDGADDVKVLREYVETVAKSRSGEWKEFYKAARQTTSA
jgi:MoxR-like ATPase